MDKLKFYITFFFQFVVKKFYWNSNAFIFVYKSKKLQNIDYGIKTICKHSKCQ